jgi:hypothetical protein
MCLILSKLQLCSVGSFLIACCFLLLFVPVTKSEKVFFSLFISQNIILTMLSAKREYAQTETLLRQCMRKMTLA